MYLIILLSLSVFFFSERCADQWLRQKGTVSDRHTKVIQAGASYTLSDRNKSPTIITLFISTKRRHQFPWHRRPPSRVPFVIIRGFFMRRAIFVKRHKPLYLAWVFTKLWRHLLLNLSHVPQLFLIHFEAMTDVVVVRPANWRPG